MEFPKAKLKPENEAFKGVPPSDVPAFINDDNQMPPHIPIARPHKEEEEDSMYIF